MKNWLIFSFLILVQFTSEEFSFAEEGKQELNQMNELILSHSSLQLDEGAFWIRKWNLTQVEGVSIKTVTNSDSNLLLTFSGPNFVYLNQQRASSLKQIGPHIYEWNWSDANVDYKRTYEINQDTLNISLDIQFKEKSPELAFLNLVSSGMKDDPETRDRELFYFANSKINRMPVNKSIDATEVPGPVKWLGAGSRYFIFAVLPVGQGPDKISVANTGPLVGQASMQYPVVGNQLHLKFKVIFIPKDLQVLRQIDPSLDTTVNLGFFTIVAYPILWLLKFIHNYVPNYGWAIIVLTIFIKILTFPLTLKSVKGMRKMAEFQPKMKALQEKYKDNKEALNREMMTMMKGSGYNPMAGCFPMLIQMPVFFALYSVLYAAVELYRTPFILHIQDLSARDPYYITPVLMTVVMFLQQKLSPPSPGMDPTQQKVMQFMPLMFGAFMITTPSGLCLYMLVNAVVSILQQLYLNKKLGAPGNASGIAIRN